MARHGRRDATHAAVRDGWRGIVGTESVRDTADLGASFGDLVLGVSGVTFILEVKPDPKAKLRPGQEKAMQAWRGAPWLRVNSFRDSVDKVREALKNMGRPAPVLA